MWWDESKSQTNPFAIAWNWTISISLALIRICCSASCSVFCSSIALFSSIRFSLISIANAPNNTNSFTKSDIVQLIIKMMQWSHKHCKQSAAKYPVGVFQSHGNLKDNTIIWHCVFYIWEMAKWKCLRSWHKQSKCLIWLIQNQIFVKWCKTTGKNEDFNR